MRSELGRKVSVIRRAQVVEPTRSPGSSQEPRSSCGASLRGPGTSTRISEGRCRRWRQGAHDSQLRPKCLGLVKDVYGLYKAGGWSIYLYRILVDVWLVGILPVTLYPFMGGKVWCRYWCPLAKMMGLLSNLYTRLGRSRFHIVANDKCIACNECSRSCQVGIDVMQYALKQETLDNATSSCIGCGICVTVCPMDTLSYSKEAGDSHDLEEARRTAAGFRDWDDVEAELNESTRL